MHVLKDLCMRLEDWIEPIVQKGDISPVELDNVYKAVKTMYYIKTMDAMQDYTDERGYSGRGYAYDGDSYRRGRNNMGQYTSRDSYENSRADIREGLERLMMNSKSEHERMEIRDMLDKLH